MGADDFHHHFISNDDFVDDNFGTLNHLTQATEATTPTVNRPNRLNHCRHNSLVDFSFIMDQSSTNTCECFKGFIYDLSQIREVCSRDGSCSEKERHT